MNRRVNYQQLIRQLQWLTADIPYEVSNLSNAAALLWMELPEINWVGFYKMVDGQLVLYPFQGKTAVVRIQVGKGVCGTAVVDDATKRVADVHQFAGHIACDCASNSEIVIPIHVNGTIWGVLDMDSPVFDRFSEEDQEGLEQFVKALEEILGR